MEERRINMCGGLDGPSAGDEYERPRAYYRPVRSSCKKETGGMRKECPKCGQINPTNTECWKCGRYN